MHNGQLYDWMITAQGSLDTVILYPFRHLL